MGKAFKHFDLPTQHLPAEGAHFVPPRARSRAEIARRRGRPAGTLVAEHQLHGLQIAANVLERVGQQDDRDLIFATRVIAVAGLNSAWYTFPSGDVMRRRLALPNMIGIDGEEPPSFADHYAMAKQGFREATIAAEGLVFAAGERSRQAAAQRMALGRQLGENSLVLACSELAPFLPFDNGERAVQAQARQLSLQTLEGARNMTEEIGTAPSLAGFADPDSDLSVFFRRNAPDGAYEALEAATATYGIAA